MNTFPIVEILVFFCRHGKLSKPAWRPSYVQHTKRIRSCHYENEGGIGRLFYSVETREGNIYDVEFNREELLWRLTPTEAQKGFLIDRVLAHTKRQKYLPSPAHRLVPLRFEIFKAADAERKTPIEKAFPERMQPYRFLRGRNHSVQVSGIETSHMENTMLTRHLHYLVEDTDGRFYHLVYTQDQMDWRLVQEVDRNFLFVQ